MAKKKNTANDNTNLDQNKEEFDDTIVTDVDEVEDLSDSEDSHDQLGDLSEILANPDKALSIKPEESDETEEVLYCPNCGVTGLFVDNVCMNCGEKKSKKSYNTVDDSSDDLIDFGAEESINLDEF